MNNMDKFCLNWNGYDTNIRESFRKLREDQRLFDVTLVTDDGQHIQAHKIILSAGSHFFSDIFLKSNQTNMLIYLKGINSVQLENLLDFLYNGEASVGQEELKEFLETGKELQVKGFEAYVAADVGESLQEEPVKYLNENIDTYENGDDNSAENNIFDTLEHVENGTLKHTNDERMKKIENSDLDLQIMQMIEKSDGIWNCKVCGKTTAKIRDIKDHAETHIEGMSHSCHICNKSYPRRPILRKHISKIHSELISCDPCGKSGMNKQAYYNHKHTRQHKTLSGTLS